MDKQMKRNFGKRYGIVFVIVCYMLLTVVCPFLVPVNVASAENTVYSNVMDDLQKDEAFNKDAFPVNIKDYSLQVIQIVESSDKELFLYVYQPCSPNEELRATSINISTGIGDDLNYNNYKLKFLNSNSVFSKYLVEGFVVKGDVLRYYDISSIFRKWNEKYDKKPEDDNVINEQPFDVSSLWTVKILEGKTLYSCQKTKNIKVLNKHVGFIRYWNGFEWFADRCDSHYVAFSTEDEIQELLESDIYYLTQSGVIEYKLTGAVDRLYGDETENYVSFTNLDKGHNDPYWLGSQDHSWNRIQTVEDFKKSVELDETQTNDLKGMQWVLRFAETSAYNIGMSSDLFYTAVKEVTVLRLKFKTNGVTYNLGVIDNKQSGNHEPDNKQPKIYPWWVYLLIGLGCITFIVSLPFIILNFPAIMIGIGKFLFAILKAVWWLITAPFSIFK